MQVVAIRVIQWTSKGKDLGGRSVTVKMRFECVCKKIQNDGQRKNKKGKKKASSYARSQFKSSAQTRLGNLTNTQICHRIA